MTHRLLLLIACLFLVIWLAATLSAKLLVKEEAQHLLYEQTRYTANHWVDILSSQQIDYDKLPEDPTRLLIVWVDDEIVIQQGPLSLAKPHAVQTYIKDLGDKQWVISSQRRDNICVVVGLNSLEQRYTAKRLITSISVLLLLVLFITGAAIYYSVSSSLRQLNQLAAQISSSSVNTLKLIPENVSIRELNPLVNAINQLIDSIKQKLCKERQFLDTCAHEIRTPVTALVALIQSHDFSKKTDILPLASMEASALRIARVANQFLNLAKSNNRCSSLAQNTQFDICELTRFILSDLISTYHQSDIQMHGDENIMVAADPLLIEIAIQNILDNAFRYGVNSNNDNKICIDYHQEGCDVIVSVEDNGPGVDKTHREKLFKRFYRVPSTGADGAGLGLSIVYDIIKQYDGTVTIGESGRLGGFKVSLRFRGIVFN